MGDGSRSAKKGSQRSSFPFATTALKAPQWARCGTFLIVIAGSIGQFFCRLRVAFFPKPHHAPFIFRIGTGAILAGLQSPTLSATLSEM